MFKLNHIWLLFACFDVGVLEAVYKVVTLVYIQKMRAKARYGYRLNILVDTVNVIMV